MKPNITAKALKQILKKHNFNFTKSLGQNFLIDNNILKIIINEVNQCNCSGILEIGPGSGALTKAMAEESKKIVAVEIDSSLIPILEEFLYGYSNVKIINYDILKINTNKLVEEEFGESKVCLVANLPYYITTPIIMNILENRVNISSMIIMVQKEVAKRIVAIPGTKDYGALSVAVQYYSIPKIITTVSPHCFIPQPKVDSIILRLNILNKPKVKVKDEKFFFKLIRAAFNQRRKTLINALNNSPNLNISKDTVKEVLSQMGLDINIRGENLSINEFANLSNYLMSF